MTVRIVKPPRRWVPTDSGPVIFLAGSIEMGLAVDWQAQVASLLGAATVVLLSPRRDDWDASWEQSIENPEFCEQVMWELDGIDRSDLVLMYFDPATKSPISLLELGLIARSADHNVLVCCPEGFWRKGNVDFVCERYKVPQFGSLPGLVAGAVAALGLDEIVPS